MAVLDTSRAVLVLDCTNLVQSARLLFGSQARVDYRKIMNLMQLRVTEAVNKSLSEIHFTKISYVSVKPGQSTQLDFLCAMAYLGFSVKTSVGFVDQSTRQLRKQSDYFIKMSQEVLGMFADDTIPAFFCIGCGSSKLRACYYKLQELGVAVELFGFTGSISSHIEDVIRHPLDASFLLA